MIVAQISDLHVKVPGQNAYRVVDTAAYLERAVARIAALDPRPDFVIATGDLVDGGLPEEYAHLRALLAPLPIPYYLVMGNHDNQRALRDAFADHAYLGHGDGPVQYVLDGDLRIIVADTTEPGTHGGVLDAQRLAWIDAALTAHSSRPAMLVLHHPPFLTGIHGMDEPRFRGADELAQIVGKHRHLERIACGHLHRPIFTRWNGTLAMTAPSTAHQLTFDLRADVAESLSLEAPAFAVHVWDGASLVSHVVAVEAGPGPYPFRDAQGFL